MIDGYKWDSLDWLSGRKYIISTEHELNLFVCNICLFMIVEFIAFYLDFLEPLVLTLL